MFIFFFMSVLKIILTVWTAPQIELIMGLLLKIFIWNQIKDISVNNFSFSLQKTKQHFFNNGFFIYFLPYLERGWGQLHTGCELF